MALLPIPSNSLAASSTCSCGSSSSLYFHLLRSSPRDLISKTPNFRICYSRGLIQARNQQSLCAIAPLQATRKKRKLRPSFFDQIRDKWSRRLESGRDKFPWQKTVEEEEVQDCQRHQFSFGDFAPESGFESDVPGNSISPSSIRGSEATKPQFGYEVRVPEQSGKRVENVDGVGEFRAKCGEDGIGGRTEKKAVQVDAMPIGLSEIGDKAVIGDVKTIPFSGNLEGSSDGNRTSVDLSWQREGIVGTAGNGDRKRKRRSNTELAEKMLPEHELQRLRNIALRMPVMTKVGVAGITQALVDSILHKRRVDEVVKLKFEAPLAFNMRSTNEIIERKTGGLVIWRSGCLIALYRGLAYKLPCAQSYTKQSLASISQHSTEISLGAPYHTSLKNKCNPNSEEILKDLSEELVDLTELNQLLDQLGPRFKDSRF